MHAMRRFIRDDRGLAAVEFALVLPVMLVLLIGGSLTSDVLGANRRMTNVAASVTDLVAQAKSITNQDIEDIFHAADALMRPYDPTELQVVVTSVILSGTKPVVAWSDKWSGGSRQAGRGVGQDLTGIIPDGTIGTGTSLIMTEVTYRFKSVFSLNSETGGSTTEGPSIFDFSDRFFDRPRRTVAVGRAP